MMHMTFYWGREVTILFDSWKTNSWLSYFLSLFFLFLFSTFYQYLEDKRLRFNHLLTGKKPSSEVTPFLSSNKSGSRPTKLAGAILFGLNSAIGYLLMLAVMSYNVGVLIAIVLGLSAGFLLFKTSDQGVVAVDSPCGCA